jgi:hypothetical protein
LMAKTVPPRIAHRMRKPSGDIRIGRQQTMGHVSKGHAYNPQTLPRRNSLTQPTESGCQCNRFARCYRPKLKLRIIAPDRYNRNDFSRHPPRCTSAHRPLLVAHARSSLPFTLRATLALLCGRCCASRAASPR